VANYVIKADTGHPNITPALFHEYARQYLQCADSFKSGESYSPIPHFLVCRAIELELKVPHLELMSRDHVKDKYGHKLKKCYDDLPSNKKILDAAEYKELVLANDIYSKKGFEYVSAGDAVTALSKFPDLSLLRQIAFKLIGQ
jgi:hypothetical protein